MKLIDYSSDSDSNDDSDHEHSSPPPAPQPRHATLPSSSSKPVKKQIILDLPRPSKAIDDEPVRKRVRTNGEGGGGLFAILPPPKRSKNTDGIVKETNVNPENVEDSGGAAKVDVPADISTTTTTKTFTPRSTQAKKGKAMPEPVTKAPSVSLFPLGPELSATTPSKPTSLQSSNPSTYEPLIAQSLPAETSSPPPFTSDTTAPIPQSSILSTSDLDTFAAHILEGRHRKNRTIEIVDYNAAEMYAQNAADKASGVLQEQVAPVRAIGSGRHQLTQLLNNVQDQRESLEEAFAKGRRIKKESGAKYGW